MEYFGVNEDRLCCWVGCDGGMRLLWVRFDKDKLDYVTLG